MCLPFNASSGAATTAAGPGLRTLIGAMLLVPAGDRKYDLLRQAARQARQATGEARARRRGGASRSALAAGGHVFIIN